MCLYLFSDDANGNKTADLNKMWRGLNIIYTLFFPCLEWRYLSDSTLILGRNEVYKYNFVNDSTFTIRLLKSNVIIDTFKLVRINIKVIDTIYVHKLKTL